MRSETGWLQFKIRYGVNQKPVVFQVALPEILPGSLEAIVSVFCRQRPGRREYLEDFIKLFEISSLSHGFFQIFLKLSGGTDGQHYCCRSLKSSFTVPYFFPFPLRAASMARMVFLLGTRRSKGIPC